MNPNDFFKAYAKNLGYTVPVEGKEAFKNASKGYIALNSINSNGTITIYESKTMSRGDLYDVEVK